MNIILLIALNIAMTIAIHKAKPSLKSMFMFSGLYVVGLDFCALVGKELITEVFWINLLLGPLFVIGATLIFHHGKLPDDSRG